MPASPKNLPPTLRVVNCTQVVVNGRRLAYFGGCDYLGLSRHPAVIGALTQAARQHGASVGASRLTTGNRALHTQLEDALADFFGAATATLLPTGYTATLAAAQALAGEITHAFLDERAHHAVRDGAQLLGTGARVRTFRHRDAADLARHLRRLGPRARPLVLTDGMFAFNGALAPLRDYLALLPPRGRLLVDDAHAAGILGTHGRGTAEHWQIPARERARLLQVISLSKAFGAAGGAVLGPRRLRERLLARSPVFAGGTPLAPPLAAAALAAVRLVRDKPELRARLQAHAATMRAALGDATDEGRHSPSPVLALFPPHARAAQAWRARLMRAGIFPSFIHYAGGPAGGYFRLAISAAHTPAQLRRLAGVMAQLAPTR